MSENPLRSALRTTRIAGLIIAALAVLAAGGLALFTGGLLGWPQRTFQLADVRVDEGRAFTSRYPKEWPGMVMVVRSQVVTENGQPLRRVEKEALVREGGSGTFFSRRNRAIFAASDESDPRTNGRIYAVHYRIEPTPVTRTALWVAGATGLLALFGGFRSRLRACLVARPTESQTFALGELTLWPWLIFALALVVRGHFLWTNPAYNDGVFVVQGSPYSDAFGWNMKAEALAGGHEMDVILPAKRPLYSMFLASFYTWTGGSLPLAKALHAVLSAFSGVLIFLIARRIAPFWAALAASLFFAFDPQQTTQTAYLMTELFGTFLVILSIWLLVGPGRRLSFWPLFAAGLAFAASNLARPLTLFGFPLYLLIIVVMGLRLGQRRLLPLALPLVAFVAGTALCLGPWIVRQKFVWGIWSLSDNTASGLFAASTPQFGAWTEEVETLPVKAGVPSNVKEPYEFFQRGFRENLQKYPGFFWQNTLRGLLPAAVGGNILTPALTQAALVAFVIVALFAWRRRNWEGLIVAGLASLLLAVAQATQSSWVILLGVVFSLWRSPLPAAILLVSFLSAILGSALFGNPALSRMRYLIDWMAAAWVYLAALEAARLIANISVGVSWRDWLPRRSMELVELKAPLPLRWLGWAVAIFFVISAGRLLTLAFLLPPSSTEAKTLTEPERERLLAALAPQIPEGEILARIPRSRPAEERDRRLFVRPVWLGNFRYFLRANEDPRHRAGMFDPRPYDRSIVPAFAAPLPFCTYPYMLIFPGELPPGLLGQRCLVVGFARMAPAHELDRFTTIETLAILPGGSVTPEALQRAILAPPVTETRDLLRVLRAKNEAPSP